jgi:hypothetical protein
MLKFTARFFAITAIITLLVSADMLVAEQRARAVLNQPEVGGPVRYSGWQNIKAQFSHIMNW